ncbi:MAG: hypothetical protein QXH08_00090 [Candidatus Hadarchaeales archaeon]
MSRGIAWREILKPFFQENLDEIKELYEERRCTDLMLGEYLKKRLGLQEAPPPYILCRLRKEFDIKKIPLRALRRAGLKEERKPPQVHHPIAVQEMAKEKYVSLGIPENHIKFIAHTVDHTIEVMGLRILLRRIQRSRASESHPYRTFVLRELIQKVDFLHCVLCDDVSGSVVAHFFIPASEVKVESLSFRMRGTIPSPKSKWYPFYENFVPLLEVRNRFLYRREERGIPLYAASSSAAFPVEGLFDPQRLFAAHQIKERVWPLTLHPDGASSSVKVNGELPQWGEDSEEDN